MWNRTDKPLVLIEAHAPSLGDDPLFEGFGVRLFSDDEDPSVDGSARNVMLQVDPGPVEARYPDPTGSGEP